MSIIFENVCKREKGGFLLHATDYTFEEGKIYGLKSDNRNITRFILYAICGLAALDRGRITVNENVVKKGVEPLKNIGKSIGEPAFILSYTGLENLQVMASVHQCITDSQIRAVLTEIGLDPDDQCTFDKYTADMKKRLAIAAAIMEEPDIILLDEPVNMLDNGGKKQVKEILNKHKARGAICIVADSDFDSIAELSDQIVEVRDQKIENIYEG